MCLYVLGTVLWCPVRFPHKDDVQFVFTSTCLLERSSLTCYLCLLRIVVSNGYWLYMSNMAVSYKGHELLLFGCSWVHPRVLVGSVLLIFLVFFCVCLLCVFTFLVPCCDVRYDFRMKTKFGSSLPSLVCRRVHVLFTWYVFIFT